MTSPQDPQHQARLARLTETVQSMQQGADLTTIKNELDGLSSSLQRLGETMQKRLSANAYRHLGPIQTLLDQARTRFDGAAAGLRAQIEQHSAALRAESGPLTSLKTQLDKLTGSPDLFATTSAKLEGLVEGLEKQVEHTTSALRGQYEPFRDAVHSLERHINDVVEALEAARESNLALQSGESLVTGCKAEWAQTGRGGDDPDGMLYLTDQRLVFMQDEKKGKMLGLFGGKQVQGELWSVPLAQISGMETERKGIIGGKAMLTVKLAAGASHSELLLEVKGGFGNERLVEFVERVRAGNFAPPVTLPDITLTVPPPAPPAQHAVTDKPGMAPVSRLEPKRLDGTVKPGQPAVPDKSAAPSLGRLEPKQPEAPVKPGLGAAPEKPAAPSLGRLEPKQPEPPVKPGQPAAPEKPAGGLASLTAAAAAVGKAGSAPVDLSDLAEHLKALKTSADPTRRKLALEALAALPTLPADALPLLLPLLSGERPTAAIVWGIVTHGKLTADSRVMEAVINGVVAGSLSYRDVCLHYAEIGAYQKLVGALDAAVASRASDAVKQVVMKERDSLGKL